MQQHRYIAGAVFVWRAGAGALLEKAGGLFEEVGVIFEETEAILEIAWV